MKKTLCIVFILSALLGLAACGECSHESWLEPTCTEPARCADCGLAEGEALGHAPYEVTCSEPGICTRCGETVAEPLPHSFGLWEINGEEMSRRCAECKAAETAPTDREMCFEELISGHWDYYVDPDNNSAFWDYAGYGGPEFWPTARFDADDKGLLTLPIADEPEQLSFYSYDWDAKEIKDYELRWEYQGFEVNSLGEDCYSFSLSLPDGIQWPGLLRVTEYELLIELKPDGANTITLFKSLYHEQNLSGYWGDYRALNSAESKFLFLELNEDRSFSAILSSGEEISGTWHAKPIMDSIGKGYSKPMNGSEVFQTYVALWYEKDGEMHSYINGIALKNESLDFGSLVYSVRSDRGLEALAALPGHWRSVNVREEYYSKNGECTSEELTETDELYIDFSEDGSFSALIDREFQGSYQLFAVSENTQGEEFTRISISLLSDGAADGKHISAEMYYYPDGLANAFRVYIQDNYENGKLKYSGIYFFRKT